MADEEKGQPPLYIGVNHVGIYTGPDTDASSLANWYAKHFGFEFIETPISYVAMEPGSGGLEIMKGESRAKGHLAIHVTDFEAARKDLESKGIELTPTIDLGPALAAYIQGTDPAGYKVHLFYIKEAKK